MKIDQNLKYLIALSLVSGIGSIRSKQLMAHFGSAEAIFKASKSSLKNIPGFGNFLVSKIFEKDYLAEAEKVLTFVDKHNINILSYLSKDYPIRLKQCEDAPLIVYQKGKPIQDDKVFISVVGTRKATEYGKHYCRKIIEDLSLSGFKPVIVSGLAYGIDACAHKSALEFGLETIAVLGHGLDRIYPSRHKDLAKSIIKSGSLITEFPQGIFPAGSNFVSRNRIVAGLSDLTIVAQSSEKGGSLITADLAFGYNREVMAIPGRIGDKTSKGCNWLIKTNKASMLESVEDIIRLMNWDVAKRNNPAVQLSLFEDLSPEQKQLFEWLKEHDESSIDEINQKSGLNKHLIPALLLDLEFMNLLKILPGKKYKTL